MGSGKTTLGSAVSKLSGATFIDLDSAIQQRIGCTISDFFEQHGEEAFRRIERYVLTDLIGAPYDKPVIIACGGGTPCYTDNMEIMNQHGSTIFLHADTEVIVRRLLEEQNSRPLIAGKTENELREFVDRSLAQRMPYYSKSTHTFCSNRLETLKQINTTAREFIAAFLPS